MRRSPMEIFKEIDLAADSILLSTSNPLSMTEGLPTTKVPIPWRRRIHPRPSNARIASRKVARETPSCCANNGSEGSRSPGAVFSISSASTTCNRWYGWIFSVIIFSLLLDYWNKFELYDIHNTQVGNAQLGDDHQGHQSIIGADDNHVMAVMCHSGGNGAVRSQTKALN